MSSHPAWLDRPPSRCRSCGAEIVWARWTKSGKRIPLDLDGEKPNLLLRHSPREFSDVAVAVDGIVEPGLGHAAAHFASCPNAAEHRK